MTDRPYAVFSFDLTAAGEADIQQEGDYFSFLTAKDSDGLVRPDAVVEIAVGRATDDFIPLALNNAVEGFAPRYRIRWAAQPDVRGHFFVSRAQGDQPAIRVSAPPAAQQVIEQRTNNLFTWTETTDDTPTLNEFAVSWRRSIRIKNVGTNTAFIGDHSGVDSADGFHLKAGEELLLENFNGEIWSICAATQTTQLSFIEEA